MPARWSKTLDVAYVDHIHIIKPMDRYRGNRTAKITEISGALKALAKELNVALVGLAQLSRAVEGRDDTMADLRDSGSLEQDADLIVFLYREEYGFDELLAATARSAEWTNDKKPRFIKYPAAWLNAGSYLNEPDKPKGTTPEAKVAEPSRGPQSFCDAIGRIGFAIIGPTASGRIIGDRAPANLAAKFPRTSSMGAHMDNPTSYDTPTCPHLRASVIAGRYGDTGRYRNDDANLDGIAREHSHKPKDTFRLIEGPTPSSFRFCATTPRQAGRLRQQIRERWAQLLEGCAQ